MKFYQLVASFRRYLFLEGRYLEFSVLVCVPLLADGTDKATLRKDALNHSFLSHTVPSIIDCLG